MLRQELSLTPGRMSRFYSPPPTSNTGVTPDEEEKREEEHRAQTILLRLPLPHGTQTVSPSKTWGKITWSGSFCMAPKQPTSAISDTRGVGDSSAASAQEDPIDRGGVRKQRERVCVSVCVRAACPFRRLAHPNLGGFPCPVLSPRFLTTPQHTWAPTPTHLFPISVTLPLASPGPCPLPHPSCGFDVQLPYKQGTPL